MDVLESALFLNDCYVTAATSFWTCVAVITAAVSFWRITAVGSRPHHKSSASPVHQTPTLQPTHAPPPPPIQSTPAVISSCCSDEDGGLTKTKFTIYYDDDFFEDEESVDGNIFISEMCQCDYRINLPVVKTVDLGWYQCQDLTVLNGSVVKLWECEGRKSSPLKRV